MHRWWGVVAATVVAVGACGGGGGAEHDQGAPGASARGADARPAPSATSGPRGASATTGSIRGTIRGRARDRTTTPLPAASVCATNHARPASRPTCVATTPDGRYALTALAKGEWRLTASAPGYVAVAWTAATPGASALLAVRDDDLAAVDLTLAAGATRVRGTVVDLEGKPIAGAWVEVIHRDHARAPDAAPYLAIADASGSFEAWSLPGRVTVRAGADGYAMRWLDGTAGAALPPLPLWPEGRIAGVVRDPAGAALADALVTVSVLPDWPDLVTRTGADGSYELRGLPEGAFQPQASAPALTGRAASKVLLTVGERVDGVDVATSAAGQVRGRAWRDAATRTPCADCTLMLSADGGAYREAIAADDGAIALDSVPAGEYRAYLASPTLGGHAQAPVTVVIGAPAELEWSTSPAGVIVGTVADEHGPRALEIAAVTLGAADAGTLAAHVWAASDGSFSLGGLPAGSYQVLVGTRNQLLGPPQKVEVVRGGAAPVPLAMVTDAPSPPPAAADGIPGCARHRGRRGTVRATDGTPVRGALVWSGSAAWDAGCGALGGATRSDAQGRFELTAGGEIVQAVVVGDAEGRRARARADAAGLALTLVAPASLDGNVTRAGLAAPACTLTLAGIERHASVTMSCAADGTFRVRGLPPDEYAVLDETTGRVLTTTALVPGGAGGLSVELTPPVPTPTP